MRSFCWGFLLLGLPGALGLWQPPILRLLIPGLVLGGSWLCLRILAMRGRGSAQGMRAAQLPELGPAALGALLGLLAGPPASTNIHPRDGGVVVATGRIAAIWPARDGKRQLRLHGGLRVRIPEHGPPLLRGDRIAVTGALDGARREVRGTGLRVFPREGWRLDRSLDALRHEASLRLQSGLPPRSAALARSLLLGERVLPRDLKERLTATGALHFFAVSGFHVALLAGLLARVVGPRWIGAWPLLLLYAGITGMRSPAARALVLASMILAARWWARRVRPLDALLLAATLLLALDPQEQSRVGFQLSFSAYAGILLLGLPCMERRPEDRWFAPRHDALRQLAKATLLVTAGAWLAGLPILLWHFHEVSFGSFPACFALLPVMPLLMVASLLHLALPSLGVGGLLISAAGRYMDWTLSGIDLLPGTPLHWVRPAPWTMALAGLGLIATARWVALGAVGRRTRRLLAGGSCVLLLFVGHPPPRAAAEALDVGHGLALFLRSAEGRSVLVDVGPEGGRTARALLDRGVAELDRVILTHAHHDHRGGLAELGRRIPLRAVHDGDLQRGASPESFLRVLWPPHCEAPEDANDASVVLHAQIADQRLLLTGDLETTGTRTLLGLHDPLGADVLLLPHHGAANGALTDLWLRSTPSRVWIAGRSAFVAERTCLTLAWLGVHPGLSESSDGVRLP